MKDHKLKIKTGIILSVFMTMMLWTCADADKEYVHDSNTISQMICKVVHGGSEFIGEILEYDKNGGLVPGEFTQERVEGGYGIIIFEIPGTLEDEFDLTNVYLAATLSWDQIVTPMLSGRHDITGEGIIITVTAGTGSKRQYRVRGYYN